MRRISVFMLLFMCLCLQDCAARTGEGDKKSETLRKPQEVVLKVGQKVQRQVPPQDAAAGFPEEFIVVSDTLVRYEGKEENVVVPEGVLAIGEGAFEKNDTITSIQLPEGLKSIKKSAFYGCSNLEEVIMPDTLEIIGDGAFERCICLEYIDLHMVKILRRAAFLGCKNLKAVDLASLEEIGEEAFRAAGIEEITGLEKVTAVGNGILTNTPIYENYLAGGEDFFVRGVLLISGQNAGGVVEIPEGTEIILDGAFWGNDRMLGVIFPDTLLEIGGNAFGGCNLLEKIYIPDSVKRLGDMAFSYCEKLQQIRLPQSLEKIPAGCFVGCDIQEITIPQGCALAGGAFYYYGTGERKITFPPDVKNLGGALRQHIDDENFNMEGYCFYTTDLSEDNFWVKVAQERGWKLEALQLEPTELVLHVGEEYVLRLNGGSDAVWCVDDDAVLGVGAGDGFGERKVFAKQEGTALVTATIYGEEYSCRVEVVAE